MNWNTSSGNFELHPAGPHFAVCIDVYDKMEKNHFYLSKNDKGEVDNREQVKVAYIEFLTSAKQRVRFKANATLGTAEKQSNLRKFLKAWNANITDAHLEKFNPEDVLGWPAYITVTHKESKGKTYANVTACMAPPPNSPVPTVPDNYVREKDRNNAQPEGTGPSAANTIAPVATTAAPLVGQDEDDLPF